MSDGFKVADAFISVHTDDDTRRGRDKIEKDTSIWASMLGGKVGRLLGVGLAGGMAKAMMAVLSGLLTVSKWLVIAAAIGAVTQAVAGLGVALAQTAGVIPLAIPAILSLISVFGALKIALSGFGAAVKAAWEGGDVDKLNALLEKLAPSAQEAVKAIVKLKPAIEGFKKAIQEAAFKGLASDIQVLAAVYLPMLQTHLAGIATIMNGLVHDLTKFFTAKDVVADWVTTFAAIRGTVANLAGGLVSILDAFRHIGVVAAPILQQLTSGFGAWAARFDALMATFQSSGQLADFIQRGIRVLGDLFELLGNIWQILSPLFTIIANSGGDVLQMMIDLTQQFADFLTSAEATQAITAVFQALNQVLKAIGPGVIAVLGGLGQALVILAPGLTALGEAIGGALVALAPALTVAAQALAMILTSLAPILPILAVFLGAFVTAIAPVLEALAPIVTQAFQDLSDILTPLLPQIAQFGMFLVDVLDVFEVFLAANLSTALGALLQIFTALMPVVMALVPPLTALIADLFAQAVPIVVQLVQALAPLLLQIGVVLVSALQKVLPKLLPVIALFVQALLPVLVELAPVIAELITSVGNLLVAALVQVVPLLEQFLGPMLAMAAQVLPSLVPLIMQLALLFINLLPFLGPVVLLFLKLASLVMPPLLIALPLLLNFLTFVITLMNAIIEPVSKVLGYFVGLTDKFIDLWGIFTTGQGVWEKFKKDVIQDWNVAWDVFVTKPAAAIKAFGEWLSDLKTKAATLPAFIIGLFSGAGNWLVDAGSSIMRGFWDGIQRLGPWLKNQVVSLIKWAIPDAVQHLLGIASPSKVMAAMSEAIPQGVALGMDRKIGSVVDAATRLAAAAMPALGIPQIPTGVATSGLGSQTTGKTGGDNYFIIDLGDGVKRVVTAVLAEQPQKVAAGSDEGSRQRNWLNPARGAAIA